MFVKFLRISTTHLSSSARSFADHWNVIPQKHLIAQNCGQKRIWKSVWCDLFLFSLCHHRNNVRKKCLDGMFYSLSRRQCRQMCSTIAVPEYVKGCWCDLATPWLFFYLRGTRFLPVSSRVSCDGCGNFPTERRQSGKRTVQKFFAWNSATPANKLIRMDFRRRSVINKIQVD